MGRRQAGRGGKYQLVHIFMATVLANDRGLFQRTLPHFEITQKCFEEHKDLDSRFPRSQSNCIVWDVMDKLV